MLIRLRQLPVYDARYHLRLCDLLHAGHSGRPDRRDGPVVAGHDDYGAGRGHVCSPLLGALADRGGYRKGFVLVATLVAVAATAALYNVLPGQVVTALVLLVVANIAFEFGGVFYNAFLPDLARFGEIGRISGLGLGDGLCGRAARANRCGPGNPRAARSALVRVFYRERRKHQGDESCSWRLGS